MPFSCKFTGMLHAHAHCLAESSGDAEIHAAMSAMMASLTLPRSQIAVDCCAGWI